MDKKLCSCCRHYERISGPSSLDSGHGFCGAEVTKAPGLLVIGWLAGDATACEYYEAVEIDRPEQQSRKPDFALVQQNWSTPTK